MLQVTAGAYSSTISSLDSGFVSQDAFSLYSAYHDPRLLMPLQLANAKVRSATTLVDPNHFFWRWNWLNHIRSRPTLTAGLRLWGALGQNILRSPTQCNNTPSVIQASVNTYWLTDYYTVSQKCQFFHRYIQEQQYAILLGCVQICHFYHTLSWGCFFITRCRFWKQKLLDFENWSLLLP